MMVCQMSRTQSLWWGLGGGSGDTLKTGENRLTFAMRAVGGGKEVLGVGG